MPELGPSTSRPPLVPDVALPNFPVWIPKDGKAKVPPVPASLVLEQKVVREEVHTVIALKLISI